MIHIEPIDLPSRSKNSHRPTLQIQELVALSYGLHPSCMIRPDGMGQREPRISHPRQVAMYLTRELTGRSYPSIGKSFGGRDHSTVIHAVHQVERRMKKDPFIRADVKALRKALEG